MTASSDPIITNEEVYRGIAEEALRAAEAFLDSHRRPKDDGSDGYILTPDPDRRSLKHSMIAIVFAGMYIEAAFWLCGSKRLGAEKYKLVDRKELEKRLPELGVQDNDLEAKLKAYRETRKELVHEKAVPLSTDRTAVRVAQKEARKAVELMFQVQQALGNHSSN